MQRSSPIKRITAGKPKHGPIVHKRQS